MLICKDCGIPLKKEGKFYHCNECNQYTEIKGDEMKNGWIKTIEKLERDLTEAYEMIIGDNYDIEETFKTCLVCGRTNAVDSNIGEHDDNCIIKKAETWMEG